MFSGPHRPEGEPMISRKMLMVALAGGLAACGSDDGAGTFHGTIAGERFEAADATGFVMHPMPCAQLAGSNATMVMVEFGNFEGLCDLAVDTAFCGVKAGAKTAYVAVVRENVNGGPVPSIEPGTYSDAGAH